MKEPIILDFDVIVTRRQNDALEIVFVVNEMEILRTVTLTVTETVIPLNYSELQGRCRLKVIKC